MTAITDEQIAKAAYDGYNDYWTENCLGDESEAWAASGRAVLALTAPAPAVPSTGEREAFEVAMGHLVELRPSATSDWTYDCTRAEFAWKGWQARAALASPSHSAPSDRCGQCGRIVCNCTSRPHSYTRPPEGESRGGGDVSSFVRASLPDVKAAEPVGFALERGDLRMVAAALEGKALAHVGDGIGARPSITSQWKLARKIRHVLKHGAAAPIKPEPRPMVDISPSATSRDRWFYEQGRLAERDPRTPKDEPRQAPSDAPITRAMVKAAMPWLNGWQHMNTATKESNVEEALRCAIAAQAQKEPKS